MTSGQGKSNMFILLFYNMNISIDPPPTKGKAQAQANATSPPPINRSTKPKPQQSEAPPCRLVPVFVDADCLGDLEAALCRLGIQTFSTAEVHRENLNHPVARQPEPEF
jgi:hypothetical protein